VDKKMSSMDGEFDFAAPAAKLSFSRIEGDCDGTSI
jgi:hypothetical protein